MPWLTLNAILKQQLYVHRNVHIGKCLWRYKKFGCPTASCWFINWQLSPTAHRSNYSLEYYFGSTSTVKKYKDKGIGPFVSVSACGPYKALCNECSLIISLSMIMQLIYNYKIYFFQFENRNCHLVCLLMVFIMITFRSLNTNLGLYYDVR